MRAPLGALAALAAALPAFAQEGGPIRTGEHADFTRVVMLVEPTTEWSLETAPGRATVLFPGRSLAFGLEGVFDRIPRDRVTDISTRITPAGTLVEIGVACDCRITASFVGAQRLALDVIDRDAPAVPLARPEGSDPALEIAAAAERAAREAIAVAGAEEALLAQIARAADQGVVRLAEDAEAPPEPAEPPAGAVLVEAPPARPEAPAPSVAEAPAEAAAPAEAGAGALAALDGLDQVATITVYDRDNAALAAARAAARVPEVCLPDAAFDLAAWSDGGSYHDQAAPLNRRLVGEFDRADPVALRDLARLQVRFGLGLEAEALLGAFDASFEERATLIDLAAVVEGRDVAPGGPLGLDVACPGAHGLWLALGGVAPVWRDAAGFSAALDAWAELPPDLRAMLGPRFTGQLLDAGRVEEAAAIYAATVRPATPATAELSLAEARLLAAEGRRDEATAALRALAESGAPNAVEALAELARLAIDSGLVLPDRLMVDLRAAALERRGAREEVVLRGLLAEALARSGDLGGALAEIRAAQADRPDAAAAFGALALALLDAADPEAVGPGAYAEAALGAVDMIPPDAAADPVRIAVAGRITQVGLPNAALRLLAPAVGRGDPMALLAAARAQIALGEAEAALATLEGLAAPQAVPLRAEALARGGAPEAAMELLAEAGDPEAAAAYAWASGDWTRARAVAEDPARAAMAGFMAARDGLAAPAPLPDDPAAITPETAFEAGLPDLRRPSLAAARALLAAGPAVDGFLEGVVAAD